MTTIELNPSKMITQSLRGSKLLGLDTPTAGVWNFVFSRAGLNVESPWRLVHEGAVLLGGSDHGQKFGLPKPVDICAETLRTLAAKTVEDARVSPTTGDICITFVDGTRIDVFNNSGGYEGWNFTDGNGLQIIAQGGGQLAIWNRNSKTPG